MASDNQLMLHPALGTTLHISTPETAGRYSVGSLEPAGNQQAKDDNECLLML